MKTIAIMNYKGGVGKTVTTINFAAELAAAGKSVIVMDADGQCNLSDIFRADTLHGGTTYEVSTHFNPNGRQCVFEQFKELILSEQLL